MLPNKFFDRDACDVAKDLLGKMIRVNHGKLFLTVQIIETEAYYKNEKASHASLGYTEKRKALFMKPGTIYMYYARGGDSLNVSCRGAGNAVLIKAAIPLFGSEDDSSMLKAMHRLNPHPNPSKKREDLRLCSGQTLLCKSLGLRVPDWDQQEFDPDRFYLDDSNHVPTSIIQTKRLGIPKGRDDHLLYRFVDSQYAALCTENPLRKRAWKVGKDYFMIDRVRKRLCHVSD